MNREQLVREVEEIIEHWDKRRNVYCEKGSPRDRVAIYDLCKLIDYIKAITDAEVLTIRGDE